MYELHPYFTNDGTVGLFSQLDDDIYHSTYGALTESWQKFILPSRLEAYLTTHDSVKILDLCYGIGYNTKTALQVFIEKALEKEKANNKIVNKFLVNKNSTKKVQISKNISTVASTDIAAIGSDNILSNEDENIKEIICENLKKIEDSSLATTYYSATIGSDNIPEDCIEDLEQNALQNHTQKNNYNKEILIDAVDMDKVLIGLSPFVITQIKNLFLARKYLREKYFVKDTNQSKLSQIHKLKNIKIKFPQKKFRLKSETSIIIFKKLLEKNFELISDPILQTILNNKKFEPFISKFMLNLSNLYSNQGYNPSKKMKLLTFLHNIYYRYVSKSYKNAQKILKNNKVDLNFHKEDARCFVKSTESTYNFIFLDAFTPSKCPCLWTVEFFKELYARLDDDGMILTYSNSAAIRHSFLKNGFSVGKIYDGKYNKYIGTVAVKNYLLIEHELDEKDLSLINSKAGICFRDENLDLDCKTIIDNRNIEIQHSELVSSSKILKDYKNEHDIKTL